MRRRRRKKTLSRLSRLSQCNALVLSLSGCKDNDFIGYKRQFCIFVIYSRLYQVYTLSTAGPLSF